jgi:3-oxoacyl-(acyl-carrier-protein) synthase
MKVFVTGLGIISAIGEDSRANFLSLKDEKTGIRFSQSYGLMIGDVNYTNEEIVKKLNLPVEDYSRTTLLGLMAAFEAWGTNVHRKDLRTGLISATSVGGMDRVEQYYQRIRKSGDKGAYAKMTYDNGRCTERTASELMFNGFIDTISTACSGGANAIMHGARMIRHNRLDRVLVGGAEPLADFDIKGFLSLNIYDPGICKPFDENRNGLSSLFAT